VDEEHHALFSKGIYFTNRRGFAEIKRNKNVVPRSKLVKEGETPIYLNWVLLGNFYPVTESPSASNSLAGKPLKKTYDSHCVLVTEKKDIFSPFNPKTDHELNYNFNQFVVSNTDQILPRYAVYYTPKSLSKKSPKIMKHIIWLDSDNTRNQDLLSKVSKIIAARVLQLYSFHAFQEWISSEAENIITDKSKCYIVCASNIDNDETAGLKICRWIKASPQWQDFPFLLLCENPTDLLFLYTSLDDMVFATCEPAVVLEYLSSGVFTGLLHSPTKRSSMKKVPSIGYVSPPYSSRTTSAKLDNKTPRKARHLPSPRSAITLPSPKKFLGYISILFTSKFLGIRFSQ